MKYQFPIMWYEGMPLEPAIFQQSFLYTEEKINYLMKNMHPYNWGILQIAFNETTMTDGIVKIKELECILPDFTHLSFPNDLDAELSINLKERMDDFKKGELTLYLSLPNNHLAYVSSIAKPRYEQKVIESIQDLNDNESTTKISFLKPTYSLKLDTTPPSGYISIPLAKIVYTGLHFQFTQFGAPCLKISTNTQLTHKLEQLIKTSKDKLKYLINKNEDGRNSLIISNIARIAFPLEQILNNDEHPYSLFSVLINGLAGAMILFSQENMPSVPEYKHTDYMRAISPLISYIESALAQIEEAYLINSFARQDGMFAIMLPNNKTDKIIISVLKQADISIEKTLNWIENAIIATEDKLINMQDQRIIGAKRERIKYAKQLDLKSKEDMLLVEITLSNTYISNQKMLCIMNFDIESMPETINLISLNTAK